MIFLEAEVAIALGAEVKGRGAAEKPAVVGAQPVPFLASLLLRHPQTKSVPNQPKMSEEKKKHEQTRSKTKKQPTDRKKSIRTELEDQEYQERLHQPSGRLPLRETLETKRRKTRHGAPPGFRSRINI